MTPACGQPLRPPKRGRDVDPDFHRGDGAGPPPHPSFRRTPESTRPPALRDSALTPARGQPLRQPKRGRDVDPDFHRGDGVGQGRAIPHPSFRGRAIPHPSFRPTPESTRPPALRDSALTPACGQPLRQPKRERDVDPDFHRGDGVGPPPNPSFRRTPESTRPPTLRDGALAPARSQPLRPPKRERDVDPDFHRGDGVGPPPNPSFRGRAIPHPSFRRTPESTRP